MTVARRSNKKAFRRLAAGGCGLAVTFFGVLAAALLLPHFLDSLQRTKQKRTMADMKAWSVALDEYREEHDGAVPEASGLDELAGLLGPGQARRLPTTDAWDTPIRYACRSETLEIGGCDTYRLVSAGRDGAFEREDPALYEPGTFDPLDYDADLVLGDGYFYRYPAPAD